MIWKKGETNKHGFNGNDAQIWSRVFLNGSDQVESVLRMRDKHMYTDSMQNLAEWIKIAPNITEVYFHNIALNRVRDLDLILDALLGCENLLSLDLSGTFVRPEVAEKIGTLLENIPLKKLDLRGSHIDDEKISKISSGLLKNSTLIELYLGNNEIRDVGMK